MDYFFLNIVTRKDLKIQERSLVVELGRVKKIVSSLKPRFVSPAPEE